MMQSTWHIVKTQCRAANAFAAWRILGYLKVRMQIGSWLEWVNTIDLPVSHED